MAKGKLVRTCKSCAFTGRQMSEEAKQKISEANTGYRHTDEAKKKISERASQPDVTDRLRQFARMRSEGLMPGPTTGMTQSKEWVERRAEALRGQKRTDEFKEQMREIRLAYIKRCGGRVLPETLAKLSKIAIELRMNGFNPARGHIQEVYNPIKPQPAFLKQRKTPYTLSSSWESIYGKYLDENPDVVSWTYEAMSIDMSGGKMHLTDFIWESQDGTIYMVEVKPKRKIERNVNGAADKLEAMIDFCADMTEETGRLWIGVLVDEDSLEALGFTV